MARERVAWQRHSRSASTERHGTAMRFKPFRKRSSSCAVVQQQAQIQNLLLQLVGWRSMSVSLRVPALQQFGISFYPSPCWVIGGRRASVSCVGYKLNFSGKTKPASCSLTAGTVGLTKERKKAMFSVIFRSEHSAGVFTAIQWPSPLNKSHNADTHFGAC